MKTKYTFSYIIYDENDNEGPEQQYVAYAYRPEQAQDEFDDWLDEQPFYNQIGLLGRTEYEC
jgi:hypothetical protein